MQLGRIVKVLSWVFLVIPFLTGCWDRLEIEERAVVLAIAIDEVKPEAAKEERDVSHLSGEVPQSQKRMLRLTVQIAVPGRIPLGPAQGGGASGEKPVWILDVVGHTVEDAIYNLQQEVADRLFLGHLRVIVVNEKVARKGLQNMNDAFRRNPEIRRAAWMVISKGEAADIIKLNPELERVPALYLLTVLDGAVKQGKMPNAFLGVFWSALTSKGQEAYLPYVEIQEQKSILLAGLAYFRGDKMVGTTTPLEIGHFMAMKGINPGGYSALSDVPGESGAVLFISSDRTAKIEVEIKNGLPHAKVKVHIEGDLAEKSNAQFNLKDPKTIAKIEKRIGTKAGKAFEELIHKTQKQGSDILGIGEIVRGKHSAYWNQSIKTMDKWQETYKEIPVRAEVTISIRRVGMKAE
ncbi:Ger(x)C family spore germination protein [Ammoniphilus resinae]|uniref:Ger(X)C family germination protein n=1 Tax=Ammoniphilus resinae TaxID=861532 RepID=A0ABS4GJW3_9BACL|nr:Ger(x)C family spore germination protein [Ammoniphilus resinae]MBP1930563.1 Ger(x)C family germination protein [Ammoniphilus resinae]